MKYETYVRPHISHGRLGRAERIAGHEMKPNAHIHARHKRRLEAMAHALIEKARAR